jgi:hypothetical protein
MEYERIFFSCGKIYFLGKSLFHGEKFISWGKVYFLGRSLFHGKKFISWGKVYFLGRSLFHGKKFISRGKNDFPRKKIGRKIDRGFFSELRHDFFERAEEKVVAVHHVELLHVIGDEDDLRHGFKKIVNGPEGSFLKQSLRHAGSSCLRGEFAPTRRVCAIRNSDAFSLVGT